MLYVTFKDGKAVFADTRASAMSQAIGIVESRWDWKSFNRVKQIAAELTASTGKLYIGTDATASTSPRYDVIEAPAVGDEVSKAFNGDSYPAGKIVKISKSLRRIETSDGLVFWRRKMTGSWINNGTWSMVAGSVYSQNPSF